MRHKLADEHKLSYFSLKAILNTILRMENKGQIYCKRKIREILNCDMDKGARRKFLRKNIQITIKNYF